MNITFTRPHCFVHAATSGWREEPLDDALRRRVLDSNKVAKWLRSLEAGFDVQDVFFDAVYFFGDKVGFAMARATATLDGKPVPGLTLIRGDSVAVKVDLVSPDGKRHTVVVRQPRLPGGLSVSCEIPAGMIDEGVFKSKAIDEINEEIGSDIAVAEEDLVPLALFYPSMGGCDECLQVFLAEKQVPFDVIRSLEGRETGAQNESESITVGVVPNDDLPIVAALDGKSLIAYYSHMARMGAVARPTIGSV